MNISAVAKSIYGEIGTSGVIPTANGYEIPAGRRIIAIFSTVSLVRLQFYDGGTWRDSQGVDGGAQDTLANQFVAVIHGAAKSGYSRFFNNTGGDATVLYIYEAWQ